MNKNKMVPVCICAFVVVVNGLYSKSFIYIYIEPKVNGVIKPGQRMDLSFDNLFPDIVTFYCRLCDGKHLWMSLKCNGVA